MDTSTRNRVQAQANLSVSAGYDQPLTFSARERQIVRLLIERGMTTQEVAGELNISPRTADTHRTNVMRKLRVALHRRPYEGVSILDLALYAITNGLVNIEVIQEKYQAA
jgi:DNA-binding CsgD family transcriptional regulator